MTLTEEQRDLFTVPQGYYLAHCISGDFALGAGIAVEFNNRFDMRNKLRRHFKQTETNCSIVIDNVFNLVTKEKAYQKPSYDSLRAALMEMKTQVEFLGVKKVAMPKIGCGLDRLDWDGVKPLLEEVFDGMDLEILVCYL